jgi:hypothetical protein
MNTSNIYSILCANARSVFEIKQVFENMCAGDI